MKVDLMTAKSLEEKPAKQARARTANTIRLFAPLGERMSWTDGVNIYLYTLGSKYIYIPWVENGVNIFHIPWVEKGSRLCDKLCCRGPIGGPCWCWHPSSFHFSAIALEFTWILYLNVPFYDHFIHCFQSRLLNDKQLHDRLVHRTMYIM